MISITGHEQFMQAIKQAPVQLNLYHL